MSAIVLAIITEHCDTYKERNVYTALKKLGTSQCFSLTVNTSDPTPQTYGPSQVTIVWDLSLFIAVWVVTNYRCDYFTLKAVNWIHNRYNFIFQTIQWQLFEHIKKSISIFIVKEWNGQTGMKQKSNAEALWQNIPEWRPKLYCCESLAAGIKHTEHLQSG